jgi:hypothetical protein
MSACGISCCDAHVSFSNSASPVIQMVVLLKVINMIGEYSFQLEFGYQSNGGSNILNEHSPNLYSDDSKNI